MELGFVFLQYYFLIKNVFLWISYEAEQFIFFELKTLFCHDSTTAATFPPPQGIWQSLMGGFFIVGHHQENDKAFVCRNNYCQNTILVTGELEVLLTSS